MSLRLLALRAKEAAQVAFFVLTDVDGDVKVVSKRSFERAVRELADKKAKTSVEVAEILADVSKVPMWAEQLAGEWDTLGRAERQCARELRERAKGHR